jgi:hypothetical protein
MGTAAEEAANSKPQGLQKNAALANRFPNFGDCSSSRLAHDRQNLTRGRFLYRHLWHSMVPSNQNPVWLDEKKPMGMKCLSFGRCGQKTLSKGQLTREGEAQWDTTTGSV